MNRIFVLLSFSDPSDREKRIKDVHFLIKEAQFEDNCVYFKDEKDFEVFDPSLHAL